MSGVASSRFAAVAAKPEGRAVINERVSHIEAKRARVAERAEAHFEKHREKWTASKYRDLLARDAPAPALKPSWAIEDPSARLMRAAKHLAERRHAGTLKRIQVAADRMSGRESSGLSR